MRIAYADPPYPGCAHLYKNHPDYRGEVDHYELCRRLLAEYDGFVLHTSSPALYDVLTALDTAAALRDSTPDWRVMAWVKPFAAFKANVPLAYAWEPVIVKPARKQKVTGRLTLRDWLAEPIALRRGLTGAKPEAVCHWCFEAVGAQPDDELDDLFSGTGAVSRAWERWRSQLSLLAQPSVEPVEPEREVS